MRILLVLPSDNTYRREGAFSRAISYAPLTLTTLAALVPDELKTDVTLVDEGVQHPVTGEERVDVVGITCVTSSAPRAYEICRHFRARGVPTVLGGAHPTLNPEDAVGYADAVVVGPAESTWSELLRQIAAGTDIRGIYRSAANAADSVSLPARHLLKRGLYLGVPTVIASRGCTNRCTYCTINHLWKGRGFRRPIGEVIDEVSGLRGRNVLLLDPNLVADRGYALSLFEGLAPLRRQWAGLATVDMAFDTELLEAAVRSGCIGLLVGFESTTQEALSNCNKTTNHVNRYREAVDILHQCGVRVLGCFMLGFDEDTLESVSHVADLAEELRIDIPRYAALTPFPGTRLFTQLKSQGRILTEDWACYDTEHVVFKPRHMSAGQLQGALVRAWSQSYTRARITARVLRVPRRPLITAAVNWGFRRYAGGISRRAAAQQSQGATHADAR